MNANVHINHKVFECLRQNKRKLYKFVMLPKKERKKFHLINPSMYES